MSINALHREWASNIRGDILAGMTVARALVPKAIAGVDPMVGLYASFCIADRQQGKSDYASGLNPESQTTPETVFS